MTLEYQEQYPEYVSAMNEAFENGYYHWYDGYALKDVPYGWSNGQFAIEMINSVWWDIKPNDAEVQKVLNMYDLPQHYCVYDKDLLEQVINYKFNSSVDEVAQKAQNDSLDWIIETDDYWLAISYGRGDAWPGSYLVIDSFEKISDNVVYAKWHHENPHDYYIDHSDNYYAILEKGTVAGKEIIGYRYLGVEPPSGDLIARYSTKIQIDDIKVLINDREIEFDQPPIIKDDRTLVPMRAIFEAMGCEVIWDDGTIDVWKDDENIMTLWIDDPEMYLAEIDEHIELDVPPQIVNDRTLVPVRAISESMGAHVQWYGDTRTVDIMYWPGYSGTTIYEDYYRNHSDILNFGLFLEDNPHMADSNGYIYSYTTETDIDSIVDDYIEELEFEGFEFIDVYDENGAIHYIMDNGEWELLIVDDYLLEHIEIWID